MGKVRDGDTAPRESAARRDGACQVAALPVRPDGAGGLEVLLITSRETGRWVIPKGWPMKGLKDHEAAAREAQEEAGVTGRIAHAPLGRFSYWKRRAEHFELCDVAVYRLDATGQLADWRERGQRERRWVDPAEAAHLVDEPGLRTLLETGLGV